LIITTPYTYLKPSSKIYTNTLDKILLNNLTTYIDMCFNGINKKNKGRLRQ